MTGGLPRFDFYPRDWYLDTRDLSREEKGVYIDLLAAMYAHGGPLRYDLDELRALLGEKSSRVVLRIVSSLIERKKLHLVEGQLVNNRTMEEIEAYRERRRVARLKASARDRGGGDQTNEPPHSRQNLRKASRDLTANSSKGSSKVEMGFEGNQRHSPNPPPSPSSPPPPTEPEKGDNDGRKSPRQGKRLNADWQASPEDIAYAQSLGYDQECIRDLAEDFRFYWTKGAGRNQALADWSGRWRAWCRSDRRRPREGGHRAGGTGTPKAGQGLYSGFAAAASREK